MDVYSNYSLSLPVEHRSIETSCHLLFWVNFSISFQGVAYLWPLIVRGSPLWGDVLLTQDWCDFGHASYDVFVISFIHLVADWPVSGFWVGLHSYRSGPWKTSLPPYFAPYSSLYIPVSGYGDMDEGLDCDKWSLFYLIMIGLKWIDIWRNILCLANRWDSTRHGGCNCQNETLVGGNLSDDFTNTTATCGPLDRTILFVKENVINLWY